jgi:membrane protein
LVVFLTQPESHLQIDAMVQKNNDKLTLKGFLTLFIAAYNAWNEDNAWRMGAALSYFAIFSLTPILIISIAISGLVFGDAAAKGQIFFKIQGIIGPGGAKFTQNMIASAGHSQSGILATIFGVLLLIIGASGAFVQLRGALNTIFHLRQKPQTTIKEYIWARLWSFVIILGIGLLLFALLLSSALISAFGEIINVQVTGLGSTMRIIELIASFVIITVLFALIFKILPEAIIRWRDVWIGAIITSLLFTAGKFLIGLYLGKTNISSTFGAAGSLVIIMLWTFYSSLIILYGAEFTRFYTERFGGKIKPKSIAEKVVTNPMV